MELDQAGRQSRRVQSEQARVTHSLANLRAEDILQTAREQARRLVGTAAAVARARREQAERAAAGALAAAEKVAAQTLAAAELRAQEIVSGSGADVDAVNDKLIRLRAALQDAEARLGAYSASTRMALAGGRDVIDLDAEEELGRLDARAADIIDLADREAIEGDIVDSEPVADADIQHPVEPTYAVPVPRIRPKGRFTVPGLTPDRIETLREELAP